MSLQEKIKLLAKAIIFLAEDKDGGWEWSELADGVRKIIDGELLEEK